MKCEVYCCPNKRKKTRGKSFFRFPRDQATINLWLKEIGREGTRINENRYVCEDHFEESFVFQWKDRKVLDRDAMPFHDYRACNVCSDPNKDEEIHGHKKKVKRQRNVAEKKEKPNTSNICPDDTQSDLDANFDSNEVYIKEELEDVEEHYLTSLEITPLCNMEMTGDEIIKDEIENTADNFLEFLDSFPIEAENNNGTTEVSTDNKEVKSTGGNKQDLLSKKFMEADSIYPSNLLDPPPINSMEPMKAICRICLANYFKGQSIFMIYKMKYLPHIVFNLTGTLPTKDDELPSMICFVCADLLLQAESTRKRCITSDKFLRKEQLKMKNNMESTESVQLTNESLNQNSESIETNENSFDIAQMNLCSSNKSSINAVSVTKEHNYINLNNKNKKKQRKEFRIRKQENFLIEEETQNEIEDVLPKTEIKADNNLRNSKLEAQYLDNTEVLYDEFFLENDLHVKEVVELKTENNDLLGMGIKLPELFVCTICSKRIPSLRAFKRHRKYHAAENFRCPVCPDELTPQTINGHLCDHKERDELICEDCGERFGEIIDLYNHLLSHIKVVKNRVLYTHECEVCGNKTPSLASHLHHMKRKHNIKDHKPFKCDKCTMKFSAKLGLIRHQENVHNRTENREKRFLCAICGTKFYTKGNLQVHTRTHTGERPYKCKYCEKSFTQINSLTVHTYIHTGEKPFVCNICGKRFKQYSHYDYHMLIHSDKRPHVCKICNRAFRVRFTLNTHMKIHGNRPFRCEICDRRYTERSILNKHMKKYHKIWPQRTVVKQEEEIIIVE